MGENFLLGEGVPWGSFPGVNFLGGNFAGGSFPGGCFPTAHNSVVHLLPDGMLI